MLSSMSLIVSSLLLFVPPNIPLPGALELCVLEAELCALDFNCSGAGSLQQCIEDYEDCSYAFPEAHMPSCRMTYVWCKLEEPATSPEADDCKAAFSLCPSI